MVLTERQGPRPDTYRKVRREGVFARVRKSEQELLFAMIWRQAHAHVGRTLSAFDG